MSQKEMKKLMEEIFQQIQKITAAGQKEYARNKNNAFANFERIGENLGHSREKVLLVYMLKHIDGITSHIDGHFSQREDVRGRITDNIVYLCLLWGMENDKTRTTIK